MLSYVIAAVIVAWLAIGLLAICACVVGGRAERRQFPPESEGLDRQPQPSRTVRAAMS